MTFIEFAKTLQAGDLFENNREQNYYLIHFVKEVNDKGMYIERAHRPQVYNGTLEKYKGSIFYSILPNHGAFLPWGSSWWDKYETFRKVGHIPALIGKRSVRVGGNFNDGDGT